MTSRQVQEKKTAAMKWANFVIGSDLVSAEWAYMLASEANIESAKGSWRKLKAVAARACTKLRHT
jgi:type III restriction enzyme